MDGRIDRWMVNGCIGEYVGGWENGWIDEGMDRWRDVLDKLLIQGQKDRWSDRLMIDGWMDNEQMDGWVDRLTDKDLRADAYQACIYCPIMNRMTEWMGRSLWMDRFAAWMELVWPDNYVKRGLTKNKIYKSRWAVNPVTRYLSLVMCAQCIAHPSIWMYSQPCLSRIRISRIIA